MQIQENGFQYPAPGSPQEWYELGVVLRRREMFGEAVNAFREAERLAERAIAELESGAGCAMDSLPCGAAAMDTPTASGPLEISDIPGVLDTPTASGPLEISDIPGALDTPTASDTVGTSVAPEAFTFPAVADGQMSDSSGTSVPTVPDLEFLESLRARAVASIELIQSIRGFVNKDLMNP